MSDTLAQKGHIVSIGIGQFGIQNLAQYWELILKEYQVDYDGNKSKQESHLIWDMFTEASDGTCIPKCIFIDSEPTCIDVVKNGKFKNLFNDATHFVSGRHDGANLFPNGKYNMKNLVDEAKHKYRMYIEAESSIYTTFQMYSIVGGTGSGLTTELGKNLEISPKKTQFIDFVLYPSPNISTNTVSPLNAVLNINECLNDSLRICLDNQGLYDMLPKESSPNFRNINCFISQIATQCSSVQFQGENSDAGTESLMTNLVPFPLMNHIIAGYWTDSSDNIETKSIINTLTHDVFFSYGDSIAYSTMSGNFLSTVMHYRGKLAMSEIQNSIQDVESSNRLQFVSWAPCHFKICQSQKPPICHDDSIFSPIAVASVLRLTNNTIAHEMLEDICKKYDLLHLYRSFGHWYDKAGLPREAFVESREVLQGIIVQYKSIHLLGQ